MVAETYNFHHGEANPRFLRNAVISLGLLVVIEGNGHFNSDKFPKTIF
jgi:hypothetical protein